MKHKTRRHLRFFFWGNPEAVHTYWGRWYLRFLRASNFLNLGIIVNVPMRFLETITLLGLVPIVLVLTISANVLHRWHLAEFYTIRDQEPSLEDLLDEAMRHRRAYIAHMQSVRHSRIDDRTPSPGRSRSLCGSAAGSNYEFRGQRLARSGERDRQESLAVG